MTAKITTTAQPHRRHKFDVKLNQVVHSVLDAHLTLRWWMILSTIAIINIGLWTYSYVILTSSATNDDDDTGSRKINDSSSSDDDDDDSSTAHHPYQRYHLFLSGIYVFVCAYRSFLPRIDLERYCLFDTRLSSIFLGRLAATVAELAFSMQLALF